MLVDIIVDNDCGSEPIKLGTIDCRFKMTSEAVIKYIEREWRSFQSTKPDTDCAFLKWLEDNSNRGFRRIAETNNLQVTVGG